MSHSSKLKLLESIIDSSYDKSLFQKFAREFFNEPKMMQGTRKTGVWREYSDHISSYSLIAKYSDVNTNELIIMSVELKKDQNVERARTMQRNFISKVLEQQEADAAIVAFYSPTNSAWRLSFVRLDYTFNEKGLDLDLTPARRYSYLVGKGEPNHTVLKQLLDIFQVDYTNPTIDEIEKAFSVEKVTKDFYKQYEKKYLQLKKYLEENPAFVKESTRLGFEVEKFSEQFAKKLMGQLAFLYFLQKKGWLGVRMLPENKIILQEDYKKIYEEVEITNKEILEKTFTSTKNGDKQLYSKALQNLSDKEAALFSDCFKGTKFEEAWGHGNKFFIREIFDFCHNNTDKNFFDGFLEPLFYEALNKKRKNHYFKQFNCKIPFLNGGLFEPIEDYKWNDLSFNLPNTLFSNQHNKGREADGILDVFDRFNFTMNEAEPLEKDVAVDPEMLGKIFENLLDSNDRKAKGAFYTPREVVHFMCKESLINFLTNEVQIPRQDIEEFIMYGDLIKDIDSRSGAGYSKELSIKPSVLNKIVDIDSALKNVTIADPAVGSGAFPLGMLGEVVKVRNNITDYLVRKDKEGFFNTYYGEEIIRRKRSTYYLKWETIKNSIFAVDFEPSAVDIAKLRLWLSVVVEQEINSDIPEPHPLPNLGFNILVGNSLIEEFEDIKLFDESILHKSNRKKKNKVEDLSLQLSLLIDDTDKLLSDMFKLQDKYYEEDNEIKKNELKKRIESIRKDLIEYKLQRDGNEKALEKYRNMNKNYQKPFFVWQLEFAKVFKEKNGFDIVIGNPPYQGFHKVPDKEYFKKKYYSASGKYDFYVLFIERGIQLLNEKGIISYICPSYFYKRNYGKNIRELMIDKSKINYICDFQDYQVFDSALTYTCIFSAEKNSDNEDHNLRVLKNGLYGSEFTIPQSSLSEPIWSLEKDEYREIINKIREKCTLSLGDITKSISQGIVTGKNDVFIFNESFINEKNIELDYLVQVYKGKDIKDGKLIDEGQYLFYPYKSIDGKNELVSESDLEENSPNLYNFLLSKKYKLLEREYFLKSNKHWYELWSPRTREHFENRKFVFSEVNNYNDFVLVNKCFYTDSACGMELKEEYKKYEKYISYYLNSKLLTSIYKKISVPKANGYLIYKNAFLKDLPILLDGIDLSLNYENINFENYLAALFDLNDAEFNKLMNISD